MTTFRILASSWVMANGRKGADPRIELRQRILSLYLALERKHRQPDLSDIQEIAWILRELDRSGMLDGAQQLENPGLVGQIAGALGITPGMLWITVVLLALLVGKPFFDFLANLLPFVG